MNKTNTHRLPSGLKIIHEASPTGVVYCGFLLRAGTRHERADEPGMAHFCEHMTFKGTVRRRSTHIINGMERVGGDLNAYTNKDETVYYATAMKEDFTRAADLLSDIVFHSTYPLREIGREAEIIADEIDSYKDSPADLIYDEFESMLFAGHPLGRDILGNADVLRTFTTDHFTRFRDAHYMPANATFFVYGDLPFSRIVKTIERTTAGVFPSFTPSPIQPLPPYAATRREVAKDTHQAHVMIGNRTFPATDERYPALFLLNNILGGPGMNSKLNVALRERAGLVYNVDSNLNHYTDTGVWSVYFGCDKADVKRCLRIAGGVLSRLAEQPLSPSALQAAIKQVIGQVRIAADNFESYAIGMAKTYAHHDRPRDIADFCHRLSLITPTALQSVAAELFAPEKRSVLVYG